MRNTTTKVLSFDDNGPGISAELRSRVFERFYRCDESHSSSVPGTGLGLSLVKRAVEANHAKIALSESTHGGCSFKVFF